MSQTIRLSRRGFLKGAAAAALVGPYVVTSGALGAPGKPAASNRLTVAHIGIGNQGSGHFGGMLGNRSAQILAVCDVRKTVRDQRQKEVDARYGQERESGEYQGCAAYNDYHEVMARADIDAVIIAVPDHWHAIVSCAAARAGKDIYQEKPLTLDIHEAWTLVDYVRRYGVVFQTGSQQRSDTKFRHACELVRNGYIGKLQTVHVGVGGPSEEKYLPEEPIPPGLDWEVWQGPAPWKPHNSERCSGNYGGGWRMIRDYSGGMMTDWGAHHFDIAQWGMGMDGNGPVEVLAPDKDNKQIRYRYASGVVMYHGGANGVLFTGTDGKVEVNRGHLKTWPDDLARATIGPNETHLYASNDHRGDWLHCIKTRSRPICDIEVGASSITVCHLGNLCYWLGRNIKWDPVKKEIIGDAEASRWLDRPKRAPYRIA
ncbi:MAG TPA: Gfo/Idh/MocA family oxidoreductase [Phycisphaerae bacterium]|nr:Gfo/Idh/MocA family oxidoreductase [Phycisphaerae bacterium]